jgi:sugar phosphate isomerase/epimerase
MAKRESASIDIRLRTGGALRVSFVPTPSRVNHSTMSTAINQRFVLNTYSYTSSGSISDHLERFAQAGFREIELMMYPGHLWPPSMDDTARAALRRELDAWGLTLRTLNQPSVDINVAAASPERHRYSLDILRSVVSLAGELGAGGAVIGPGKPNPLFPAPVECLLG